MELLIGTRNARSRAPWRTQATAASSRAAGVLYALLSCLALFAAVGPLAAQAQAPEYRVKAVFLLNFTRFIEWPPDALGSNAPFNVCVLGDDPFQGALEETFQGESVQGHPVAIRHTKRGEDIGGCRVLFIARSERELARALLEKLQGEPILAVSEQDDFCENGGAIRLFTEDRHVRFALNPDACEAAGLHVSSRLLSVARIVRTTKRARKAA